MLPIRPITQCQFSGLHPLVQWKLAAGQQGRYTGEWGGPDIRIKYIAHDNLRSYQSCRSFEPRLSINEGSSAAASRPVSCTASALQCSMVEATNCKMMGTQRVIGVRRWPPEFESLQYSTPGHETGPHSRTPHAWSHAVATAVGCGQCMLFLIGGWMGVEKLAGHPLGSHPREASCCCWDCRTVAAARFGPTDQTDSMRTFWASLFWVLDARELSTFTPAFPAVPLVPASAHHKPRSIVCCPPPVLFWQCCSSHVVPGRGCWK